MGDKVALKQATRRVPIIVKETVAEEVRVTGNFTDWVKDGIRLSHDGNGEWRTVLPLEPGDYQSEPAPGRWGVEGPRRSDEARGESVQVGELRS